MNMSEYVKSLLYEYRLNKDKATLVEMKHNLWQLRRNPLWNK